MEYPAQLPGYLRSRKKPGPPRRVWFFRQQFFLEEECLRSFRRLGLEVRPWQVEDRWDGPAVSRFLAGLLEWQPDFFFSINHLGFDQSGWLTQLLRDSELPAATWYVDNPDFIVRPYPQNVSQWVYLFVWDRHYLEDLGHMGFPHLAYLPLATDPQLFRPYRALPPQRFGSPPAAFLGSTWSQRVEQQLAQFQSSPERLAVIEEAARRFILSPAYKARDELEAVLPGFAALPLTERINLEAAALWRASQLHRLARVQALLPGGLRVYGDPAWQQLLPDPSAYGGPVGYNRELPAFYQSVTVNLNITSLQMKDGLNQRLFDVPATGSMLLTDFRPALGELFDPEEVAAYHSPEEARTLLEYYRSHPEARQRLAGRARERVLKEHTYLHRVRTILSHLTARFF
jgi:spore maturation protein CgeB